MVISVIARKCLLIVSIFASIQLTAMERNLSQEAAEKMVNDRKIFLINKINRCDALLRNNYSLRGYSFSDDEKSSISDRKIMWRDELEGLNSWVEVEGEATIGHCLAENLQKNGTKSQTFFREDGYDMERTELICRKAITTIFRKCDL
jgi:hypothetical protein